MQHTRASVLIAPVLILSLFAPTLCGLDRLAFRDVGHFYTPLYDYVAERCSENWLPLWNPLDQTGIPLIGETTTAVLYPVRHLIYSLPLSSESAMAWYVVIHLILASFAANLLARWSGLSTFAATIASLVYPLSGTVLFLYTNPPFLVGAAWLPFVLGALLAPDAGVNRMRIVCGGAAMSMMILGGDPQSALHAMIIASAVWCVALLRRRKNPVQLIVLLSVPLLAAVLAAPQLAASIAWSRQSDRLQGTDHGHWSDPPLVGSKRHETYQYSLPPWHLAELTTPNAFGAFLPVNHRISRLLPGDGRAWTPSIYMGMIVLLAMLLRLRQRCGGPWLTIFVVTIGLSLGHFGFVWFLQCFSGRLEHFDSAIGGPYWWLYQCVPGYDSFRYPAKWLAIASLAASIVSAQVFASVDRSQLQRVAICVASFLAVVLALLQTLRWRDWDSMPWPTDEFWGPLQFSSGLHQVSLSLAHSIVVLLIVVFVIRRSVARSWSLRHWRIVMVAVVAVDLSICGYGLIYRVPVMTERLAIEATGGPLQAGNMAWMRTQSDSGWPSVWRETSDSDRLVEVEASSRAAWFGRWHLASRANTFNNMVSIRSEAMSRFWRATKVCTAEMSLKEQEEFWNSVRTWLAIGSVLHTSGSAIATDIEGHSVSLVDRRTSVNKDVPALQAYSHWNTQASSVTTEDLVNRLQQLGSTFEHDAARQIPIVESNTTSEALGMDGTRMFRFELGDQTPESAEFHLTVDRDVLITRPVLQDGDWSASFTPILAQTAEIQSFVWKPIDVMPVDGIKQGIFLTAGQWTVRFQYAPA
ncbi:MAG: hypothetical protein ACR2NZ_26050, partial [Rubripirellula sp.]